MRLKGDLTLGEEASTLRYAIRDQKAGSRILLDMRGVKHIDASGMGELENGSVLTRHSGGEIKMFGLQAVAVDVLQLAKLFTIFEQHPEEEAVRRSFGAARSDVALKRATALPVLKA